MATISGVTGVPQLKDDQFTSGFLETIVTFGASKKLCIFSCEILSAPWIAANLTGELHKFRMVSQGPEHSLSFGANQRNQFVSWTVCPCPLIRFWSTVSKTTILWLSPNQRLINLLVASMIHFWSFQKKTWLGKPVKTRGVLLACPLQLSSEQKRLVKCMDSFWLPFSTIRKRPSFAKEITLPFQPIRRKTKPKTSPCQGQVSPSQGLVLNDPCLPPQSPKAILRKKKAKGASGF